MICAKCGKKYVGSSHCTYCGYDITSLEKAGFVFKLSAADIPLLIEQRPTKDYLQRASDITSGSEGWRNGLEAVRWYVKAAVRGDIEALCNLGDVLLGGIHDSVADVYNASEMFCRAAELGSRDAAELVDMLGLGNGEDDYADEQEIIKKYRETKRDGRWKGDLVEDNLKLAGIVAKYHSLRVDRLVMAEMAKGREGPFIQIFWIRKNYQIYKELRDKEGEDIKYEILEIIYNEGETI